MHDENITEKTGENMGSKIITLIIIPCIMVFFISSCQLKKNQYQLITRKLNTITKLEQIYVAAGKEIQDIEIKELEIYERIYTFKESELEGRKNIAQKAIALLNKRDKRIDAESKLIHDIDIKIEELRTINKETKSDKLKEEVNQFIHSWQNRTKLYDELNVKYKEAINTDLTVYNLLSQKKIDLNKIRTKTKYTNHIYKVVLKKNDKYNLYSQKLNQARKKIEDYGK